MTIAAGGLAAGGVAHLMDRGDLAPLIWTAAVLPVLAALVWEILVSLARGLIGLDIVAALSMSAALGFGETLAAAVVALMYAGGGVLEEIASARATRDMRALLSRSPRHAMRHRDGGLEMVPIESIAVGDRLLVRQGDVLPADGRVLGDLAVLDLAALTGESVPRQFAKGEAVPSGAANAGHSFDMQVDSLPSDSTYAAIVRLVESAQAARAPMVRMADRYSLAFLLLTLAIAGAAWWLTGDPVRVVAVLVVATPCPLILGVPVALVAGLSRAARAGVLVKGGGALEVMARARVLILDKTGTLTDGRPRVVGIWSHGISHDEALRLAAALDQGSRHPVAEALVAEARARGLDLPVPEGLREWPGDGVTGRVAGHEVTVGGEGFVARQTGQARHKTAVAGAMTVAMAIDGKLAARFTCADRLREGTGPFLQGARAQGLSRIVMATGDRADVAASITEGLGFDRVEAELAPGDKLALVEEEKRHGLVMMVGDGVNDAPALAAADLGIAMGARGASASAETADVVILVDRLDRILPGLRIAKGARAIALQSVIAGLGLSLAGMVAAAFGYLAPVEGAMLQEVIDVAVILNALRALRIDGGLTPERST